jgi:hypothetical protein
VASPSARRPRLRPPAPFSLFSSSSPTCRRRPTTHPCPPLRRTPAGRAPPPPPLTRARHPSRSSLSPPSSVHPRLRSAARRSLRGLPYVRPSHRCLFPPPLPARPPLCPNPTPRPLRQSHTVRPLSLPIRRGLQSAASTVSPPAPSTSLASPSSLSLNATTHTFLDRRTNKGCAPAAGDQTITAVAPITISAAPR